MWPLVASATFSKRFLKMTENGSQIFHSDHLLPRRVAFQHPKAERFAFSFFQACFFEEVRKLDPFKLEQLDILSHILYVPPSLLRRRYKQSAKCVDRIEVRLSFPVLFLVAMN